ncbi:MAG TPA: phasin family protein [Burkholderiaceae bacterium]|nr:phasin family protein [Burkholderiaceae bacterium]
MVKKLKALAEGKSEQNQLASAIKESAQQIWLAGLGAFAKAQEEGNKVFEALAREGAAIQSRSRAFTGDRLGEVGEKMTRAASDVARQATTGWDKLEQVFEERVGRALKRLGVPTNQEVQSLIARVEQLNDAVQALGGKPARARAAAPAGAGAAKPRAAKRVAKAGAKAGAKTARAAKAAGNATPKPARAPRKKAAPAADAPAAE